MRMPGFSAEASLYLAKMKNQNSELALRDGAIYPAIMRLDCSDCLKSCKKQGGETWECKWICNFVVRCGRPY